MVKGFSPSLLCHFNCFIQLLPSTEFRKKRREKKVYTNKKTLSIKPAWNIFKNKTESCQIPGDGWVVSGCSGLREEHRVMRMPTCTWVRNSGVSLLTAPKVQQNST